MTNKITSLKLGRNIPRLHKWYNLSNFLKFISNKKFKLIQLFKKQTKKIWM